MRMQRSVGSVRVLALGPCRRLCLLFYLALKKTLHFYDAPNIMAIIWLDGELFELACDVGSSGNI